MDDLAKLIMRVTFGGFLAGHGAQKLLGYFGGPGPEGTAAWLESLELRPGKQWTYAAAASEFGGGLLTMLGFLWPLGPVATVGSMGMATATAHADKPIWVNAGGAELPVTNMAIASTLLIGGPGKLSLDTLLKTKLPGWYAIPGLAVVAGTIWYATRVREERHAQQSGQQSSVA